MSRAPRFVLVCLSLFLLAFPLTLGKPGLPTNLKADESAYYLMALSLAHDGDLLLEQKDVARAFQEFPFQPVNNLILMTDDGWQTVYFGKPYVYSLLAAPFAAVLGANGMILFNMAMLVAMIWMGTFYLSRFNDEATAALFSAGFFLLSVSFAYVFWLQPEIFNMAGVAACLFFGLRPVDERPRRAAVFAAISGAALALAVYNKPMLAAVALPIVYVQIRRRWWRVAAGWLVGAALALGVTAGISTGLTGHSSSYLGVVRQGVSLCRPDEMPIDPTTGIQPPAAGGENREGGGALSRVAGQGGGLPAAAAPTAKPEPFRSNSWGWLFRIPRLTLSETLENFGYFLWGRHTGLLLYLPWSALATLLFLLHARRSAERWLLLAGLVAVALFFLLFISFNWHGGGGFLGNRYFATVYPGFLFLVTRIRPRWTMPAASAWAGLFLAPLLFSPFGVPGPEPTLQAHTRNFPYRFFPLELSLRNIPGYERISLGDRLRVVGRKDVFLPQAGELWLRGAGVDELWLISVDPLPSLVFQVRNVAPGNPIRLTLGDAQAEVDLPAGGETRVELRPGGPDRVRRQRNGTWYVYHLEVTPETGRMRPWTRIAPPNDCPYFAYDPTRSESFFLGAALTYLGSAEHLAADVYRVTWDRVLAPAAVHAGQIFTVPVRLFNRSRAAWTAEGSSRVALSYHWRDAAGKEVVRDGRRSDLPLPVPPGGRARVFQRIEAPAIPGRYELELDLVLEGVSWFSDRAPGQTYRTAIEVLPAIPGPVPEPGSEPVPSPIGGPVGSEP